MSEEQFKEFMNAVNANNVLQEQLKTAADADAVVAIAKEAGFVISTEDLKQAKAEVSDDELESVGAGFGSLQACRWRLEQTWHPDGFEPLTPRQIEKLRANKN